MKTISPAALILAAGEFFKTTDRGPYIATPHSDQGQRTRSQNGPQPIHDVVVSAVAAAVMAATIIFNSTSQNREFFIRLSPNPLPVREGRRYLGGSISFNR